MFILKYKFFSFIHNQRAVTSIEYGLIAVAMAVLVLIVISGDRSFTSALSTKFNEMATLITNAVVRTN